MKAEEIIEGGIYIAKVTQKLVPCKVLRITKQEGYKAPPLSGRRSRKAKTFYAVKNLRTGRETTFRSASKFRRVARLAECDYTKQFEEKVEGLKPETDNLRTLPKKEHRELHDTIRDPRFRSGPRPVDSVDDLSATVAVQEKAIDDLARTLAGRLTYLKPEKMPEFAIRMNDLARGAVKGWLLRYARSDLARYFAESELAPTT